MTKRRALIDAQRVLSRAEIDVRVATIRDYGLLTASIWVVWAPAVRALVTA